MLISITHTDRIAMRKADERIERTFRLTKTEIAASRRLDRIAMEETLDPDVQRQRKCRRAAYQNKTWRDHHVDS